MPGSIERRLRKLYDRWSSRPPMPSLEIGRFGGFEVAYRDHTADVRVLEESFEHDLFFAGVPEYQPTPDDLIIDVGAHIGTFSLLASARVPSGRVYAIEASRESYHLCRINVRLNEIRTIEVFHLALADRPGECTLHHAEGNWGHSTVARRGVGGEVVKAETLAGFMESNRIHRCNFLKMNCEGAEFPILLSTPADVLRRVETMLVLYHNDLWRGETDADLVAHLQRCGFECSIRERTARRGWIVARRLRA